MITFNAFKFCKENEIEISFTSPGWIAAERLIEKGYASVPNCGACLSNMAIWRRYTNKGIRKIFTNQKAG